MTRKLKRLFIDCYFPSGALSPPPNPPTLKLKNHYISTSFHHILKFVYSLPNIIAFHRYKIGEPPPALSDGLNRGLQPLNKSPLRLSFRLPRLLFALDPSRQFWDKAFKYYRTKLNIFFNVQM